MKKFRLSGSSLLGAGLGWWLLGPVGALLGLVFGSIEFDEREAEQYEGNPRDGFVASLLVLMAAVMKADGKVVKAELDYVKLYLVRSLGESHASDALLSLREILKQDIDTRQVCNQIANHVDYDSRVQLVHMLFGVASSDGNIPESERNEIAFIARMLLISLPDYNSIEAMYYKNVDSAYKVLEIAASVSDDEVKKAYRKMAVKFHPDKVAHLGEEFQQSAKEKFQKVNEAFEQIKKERGIR
ncbi:TerB family tellurite resistance protein [Saccharicrinis aurantiacus]|uniref:TerB family tellurite resistance protein n=1 Tax=Saccharicrinis aurantiacus TaxID=1849719 RepID=UPI0009501E6E|nr:TerB family tellurite resistance protein [Saccharicrinis aurantiacus]